MPTAPSSLPTIVWFRQDLRLADNPALYHAAQQGPVLPVFILDTVHTRPIGGAGRWWLHHSLTHLTKSMGGLIVRAGDPATVLAELIEASGARRVHWNRCYEPDAIKRDQAINADLQSKGLDVESFNGALLNEPWEIATKTGGPYKVYSPYWRAAAGRDGADPVPVPEIQLADLSDYDGTLEDLDLLPCSPNWAAGWEALWQPGEAGAAAQLDWFLDTGLRDYSTLRDRPDRENTSRLSPHLHWGEISPRQIRAKAAALGSKPELAGDSNKFMAEIGWREFAYHLLYHFPDLPTANWKPAFDAYPWRDDPDDLRAWQHGMTGYPIVDAGMRELWRTGYMHNRVRMIVASFLIKHLRLHWKHGEAWFWDTLLDADAANNAASWQWVAGSGADASPYFRIFNPMTQGRKFDPQGDYVRHWCPELADLDTKYIHAPFEATEIELAAADIKLGETYPLPIVDHGAARQAALDGYEHVRNAQ